MAGKTSRNVKRSRVGYSVTKDRDQIRRRETRKMTSLKLSAQKAKMRKK